MTKPARSPRRSCPAPADRRNQPERTACSSAVRLREPASSRWASLPGTRWAPGPRHSPRSKDFGRPGSRPKTLTAGPDGGRPSPDEGRQRQRDRDHRRADTGAGRACWVPSQCGGARPVGPQHPAVAVPGRPGRGRPVDRPAAQAAGRLIRSGNADQLRRRPVRVAAGDPVPGLPAGDRATARSGAAAADGPGKHRGGSSGKRPGTPDAGRGPAPAHAPRPVLRPARCRTGCCPGCSTTRWPREPPSP